MSLLFPLKERLQLTPAQEKNYTIVCDGEAALIAAWTTLFPSMKLVLCYNHCKESIKRKLYDMGKKATITEDQLSQVMMLISGTDEYRGLLDYSSEELTTDVIEKLYSAWYVY